MANLCRSPPVSSVCPNPSLSSSIASYGTKRQRVECLHLVILEAKCSSWERPFDDDPSLPFAFLIPALRLSPGFANRMHELSIEATLGLKKLHLVLDLDHRLLHTVRVSNLTPEEEERLKPVAERTTEGGDNIFLVGSETGQDFITKLRSFVRESLRDAFKTFELTVYTMGGRVYSSRMTKPLDPNGV